MTKTERIGLVLSTEEKTAGKRLAEAEGGLSFAALVRRLIRTEANRRGLWPIVHHTQPKLDASQPGERHDHN
jgi:hypothetical protein